MSDNNSFLRVNRFPVDYMIDMLRLSFKPDVAQDGYVQMVWVQLWLVRNKSCRLLRASQTRPTHPLPHPACLLQL